MKFDYGNLELKKATPRANLSRLASRVPKVGGRLPFPGTSAGVPALLIQQSCTPFVFARVAPLRHPLHPSPLAGALVMGDGIIAHGF